MWLKPNLSLGIDRNGRTYQFQWEYGEIQLGTWNRRHRQISLQLWYRRIYVLYKWKVNTIAHNYYLCAQLKGITQGISRHIHSAHTFSGECSSLQKLALRSGSTYCFWKHSSELNERKKMKIKQRKGALTRWFSDWSHDDWYWAAVKGEMSTFRQARGLLRLYKRGAIRWITRLLFL